MKSYRNPILIVSLLLTLAHANANELRFNSAGFSIEPLLVQESGADYTAMQMFLEASDGFAPNVNVRKTFYDGTMTEFLEQSKKDFENLGWEVLDARLMDDNSMLLEATGIYNDMNLHWYIRAVQSREAIYLATATSLESQWMSNGRILRRSVDSLRSLRR